MAPTVAAWNTKANPPVPRCQKPGPKAKQKPLPLQQYFPRSSLQFTIQLVHPWSQKLLPALLPCLLNTWSCGPCFVQPPLAIFYQPMCDQGVSIPALQRFQISDFVGFFRMSTGESHTLMQALENRAAAGASSSSLATCVVLHLLIPFPCLIMFLLCVPSLCTMLLCLRCCLGLQRV